MNSAAQARIGSRRPSARYSHAVGRARSLAVLFVAVLAALACITAGASAASFTWDLTHDFTTTAPGANPDKDSYGGHPWSYEKGGQNRLDKFATDINGGLPGWEDSATGSPYVAINGGTGQAVLQPTTTSPAVVAWTSPVSGTVSVSGSVTADQPGGLLCPTATWSVGHGATTLAAGTATTSPASFSKPVAVNAGERITLAVSVPILLPLQTPNCTDTSATFTVTQAGSAPGVTLSTPANGATITGGQPRFSGGAAAGFGVSNQVTVRVYNGSGTTGIPAETLTATASGGAYSVTPSPALPDGTYTAQAEQDSASGAQGLSAKNTFLLETAAPTITLNSPGAAPLQTATPTLTGVAAHGTSVRITIYPGDTTNSTPLGSATGASGADGRFSIRLPSLPDGRYTVIASDGAGGISHPVTFRIKAHAPALTLTDPLAGGHLSQAAPIFMGAAGSGLGDSAQVSIQLFHGASTKAKNLGTKRVNEANGSWILQWPNHLALGTYTVRISQGDDAGHTSTITRAFAVVPANSAIGSSVSISGSGDASLPVWCTAPSTQTCTGTVLILTKKTYRTSGGGLAGRLRVMFAYVSITGGRTVTVKRRVQADALHALRRARSGTGRRRRDAELREWAPAQSWRHPRDHGPKRRSPIIHGDDRALHAARDGRDLVRPRPLRGDAPGRGRRLRGDGRPDGRGARGDPRRHVHRRGDQRAREGHRPRHRRVRRRARRSPPARPVAGSITGSPRATCSTPASRSSCGAVADVVLPGGAAPRARRWPNRPAPTSTRCASGAPTGSTPSRRRSGSSWPGSRSRRRATSSGSSGVRQASVGALSGAVGTYSATSPDFERRVL